MTSQIFIESSKEPPSKLNPYQEAIEDDDEILSNFSGHTVSGERQQQEDVVSQQVKEIRAKSAKDTRLIGIWRLIVVASLVVTAIAITISTYRILKDEQNQNFITAFEQFARTIEDSAIQQQTRISEGFRGMAEFYTTYVEGHPEMTWPNVTVPRSEKTSSILLEQTGIEFWALLPLIQRNQRDAWVEYSTANYENWVMDGHMIQSGNLDRLKQAGYNEFISRGSPQGFIPDEERDFYTPSWVMSPPPSTYGNVNWNLASVPHIDAIIQAAMKLGNQTLAAAVRPYINAIGTVMTPEEHDALHNSNSDIPTTDFPHSSFFYPVHESLDDDSPIVGLIAGGAAWDRSLVRNVLPENVLGIFAVIQNNCNQSFTYEIFGKVAYYKGVGDLHDPSYDDLEVAVNLSPKGHPKFDETPGHCQFSLHIYPSDEFKASYESSTPKIFVTIIAITFGIIIMIFVVFDCFVRSRNSKLVADAARSYALIASLFPKNIRNRLMAYQQGEPNAAKTTTESNNPNGLRSELNGSDNKPSTSADPPLADLFLDTTIIFADLVGFTAWSSAREPTHVFMLLETLYGAFDTIAKKNGVFKVETIGDCYVASVGVPEPCKDHAVAAAKFAHQIMIKMATLTKHLETILGTGTGDLSLRVGMHSGPVTAGVLRGERARFQLFGDTMNMASRVESTGKPGRIQMSADTAELLIRWGKASWVQKRTDEVVAKGKGSIQTYWLVKEDPEILTRIAADSISDIESELQESSSTGVKSLMTDMKAKESISRLIDWNTKRLHDLLKQVVARRASREALVESGKVVYPVKRSPSCVAMFDCTPLEEVQEIIALPDLDQPAAVLSKPANIDATIKPEVVAQFRDYVTCIAGMYGNNFFHNFDHASHVVMSVIKLMSRIVAPTRTANEDLGAAASKHDHKSAEATLHDHTYGITLDPLTQFACAFSALIHDVDHSGVPNTQLTRENQPLATRYKERSVAEQNSFDLAWALFMDDRFADFRMALCATPAELQRFRQLVINSVMATDIMDKDLKTLRDKRWDKAFVDCVNPGTCDAMNRKATIVIEHLIQASDVAHTMQHWHVYLKWNSRLFQEMNKAFQEGRGEVDPSKTWYEGELAFFDYYVIPLAHKLKDCGVFGVSSDEYLAFALKNRQEWKERGREVVSTLLESDKNMN